MDKPLPCDEPCPKCGNDDISRKLRRKGEYYKNDLFEVNWNCRNDCKQVSNGFFGVAMFCPNCETVYALKNGPWINQNNHGHDVFTKDCIANHCRCCHYEWGSEPLSGKDKSDA